MRSHVAVLVVTAPILVGVDIAACADNSQMPPQTPSTTSATPVSIPSAGGKYDTPTVSPTPLGTGSSIQPGSPASSVAVDGGH